MAAAAPQHEVRVSATQLELAKGFALPRGKGKVYVEFDLLGVESAKSEAIAPVNGKADLRLAATLALPPGGRARAAVMDALDSQTHDDSDVSFTLYATDGGRTAPVVLGRGMVNLETMLDDEKDVRDRPLKLVVEPPKPAVGRRGAAAELNVGTLVVSLLALPALRDIDDALAKHDSATKAKAAEAALAPAAPSTVSTATPPGAHAIRVSVGEIELGRGFALPTFKPRLVCTVDLLGAASVASEPAPVSRSRAVLALSRTFDAPPGSREREALLGALDSDDRTDSDVAFVLTATDSRGANGVPFARAALNLEELFDAGRDALGVRLALAPADARKAQAGTSAGTLVVSVEALAALRDVDAALERHGDARTAKTAEARAASGERAAAREPPAASGARARAPAPAVVAAAAGAETRVSLAAAGASVRTAEPQTAARRPRSSAQRPVGSSTERLPEPAGAERLEFRVSALQLLDEPRLPAHVDGFVLELDPLDLAHARSDVLRRSAADARGLLRDVELEHALPAGPGTRARELLIDALASESREDSDVYFTLYGLDRDATRAAADRRAPAPAGKAGEEMGVGHVNLEALLADGADYVDRPLTLADRSGAPVATVTVSVRALAVLRSADAALDAHGSAAKAKLAQRAAAPGAARKPTARFVGIEVAISAISIREMARSVPAAIDELVLEFDLLGVLGVSSQPVRVRPDGEMRGVGFRQIFSCGVGTRARRELLDALESESREDSDVYFTLYGLDRDATRAEPARIELANAYVNLEELLRNGADLLDAKLPLVLAPPQARAGGGARGSGGAARESPRARLDAGGAAAEVGTVTMTVRALGALRDADAALDAHGSAKEAERFERERFEPAPRDPPGGELPRDVLDGDTTARVARQRAADSAAADGGARADRRGARGARASRGAEDTIAVEVERFELASADELPREADELVVSVDMPNLPDELWTKRVRIDERGRSHAFAFEHAVDVRAGSKARAELMDALESASREDSAVIFTVCTVDLQAKPGAAPQPLGTCELNLEELLDAARADALGERLTVLSADGRKRRVGTLVVSVRALAALREIDAALERHGGAAGAKRAEAALAPSPARAAEPRARDVRDAVRQDVRVTVGIAKLELSDVRTVPPQVDDVTVEYEFVGREVVRSARVPLHDDGRHLYETAAQLDVSAGTALRFALMEAIESSRTADADTSFVVYGHERASGGKGIELARSRLNLQGLLSSGKDVLGAQLELVDRDGKRAGTLTATVEAVAALRDIDDALERHGDARAARQAEERADARDVAPSARVDGARRRPSRAAARADGGEGARGAGVDKLTLHVGLLTVDDVGALEDSIDELQLVVVVPGAAVPLASARVGVQDSGRHVLDWREVVDVHAGAPVWRALTEALGEDGRDEASELRLELRGAPRGQPANAARELGVGTLALADVLARGRDFAAEAVPLLAPRGGGGRVGSVVLTTSALPALIAIDRAIERAGSAREAISAAGAAPLARGASPPPPAGRRAGRARARARGGGGGGDAAAERARSTSELGAAVADGEDGDVIAVSVSRVVLFDVERDLGAGAALLELRLDLLGVTEGERAPPCAVQRDGDHAVRYAKRFDASAGSALREALLDALDSRSREDSDVYFTLYELDRGARPGAVGVEVGSTFINLEQALAEPASRAAAERVLPLARTTRAGTRTVGELTLRLDARAALRTADAALEAHGGADGAKAAERQLAQRRQRAGASAGARGAPAAGRARAPPAASTLGADECIVVTIHELLLDHVGELPRGVDELEFEFDFLATDDIRSGPMAVEADGSHLVAFDKAFEVPLGSRARELLLDALESESREDSDVYFTLWAIDKDAPDLRTGLPSRVEIGAAFANLEELLARGRDIDNEALPILSVLKGRERDKIGSVRLTIRALEAMRSVDSAIDTHGTAKAAKVVEREAGKRLRAERERDARASERARGGERSPPARSPPARSAARASADPSAEVAVSTLELGSAARRAVASADSLCVRVDFPGAPLAHSRAVRSADVGPSGMRAPLGLTHAVALGVGSDAGLAARRELLEALDSEDADDGDVVFELLALSASDTELVAQRGTSARARAPAGRVLASGTLSLDELLTRGADVRGARVELLDATGAAASPGAPLGALLVDVRALDALRELDAALERHGGAAGAIAADAARARAARADAALARSPAARRDAPLPPPSAAARESARRVRAATPYHDLPPRARAAFAKAAAELRGARAARAAALAGALARAPTDSQLARRAAGGGVESLGGALAAALSDGSGGGGGDAAQLLLRPVRAEGVPRVPAGYVETARTLRLCVLDVRSASMRGNVAELGARPARDTAGAAAAAAAAEPWAFDNKGPQLLARAPASLIDGGALLIVQLDATVVPAPADGGGGGGGAGGARRGGAGAGAGGGSVYARRRHARPRTLALCWGALPLELLAEWRPARPGQPSGAVRERAVPLHRGSAFDGSGPLAVRADVQRAARDDATGRRARAAAPAAAADAQPRGARAPMRGAVLTLALAPPSAAELGVAARLPAQLLLCEAEHMRMLSMHAQLLRDAADDAARASAPSGGLHWAPGAAALAQLARTPDTLRALQRVWAARARGAKGSDGERAALGHAAVALCVLLNAAGVSFAREPANSMADEKRRADAIGAAERAAADGARTLASLAAPAAGALLPPFRHALLVHDPAALAASRRM